MLTPPLLKSGDRVGLVATGRKISAENLQAACSIISSWGMTVVLSSNIHSKAHTYLAASDEQRLRDFQQFVIDPRIKAIICARGGYGTTRILDQIDFGLLLENPKWIVGFSDITALHLKLHKLGINSIHGTMPILFSNATSSLSVESLRRTLTGERECITAEPSNGNKHGFTTGQIIGGNLSLIVDSLGTSSEPDTDGKILVLEEIDEYSYRIDRMLTHLKRSGKLDHLAGLVVGHMTDIKESELSFGETIEDIVLDKTRGAKYPIGFNFPIGHENPNLAWVHGSLMKLDVTEIGGQLSPVNEDLMQSPWRQ